MERVNLVDLTIILYLLQKACYIIKKLLYAQARMSKLSMYIIEWVYIAISVIIL